MQNSRAAKIESWQPSCVDAAAPLQPDHPFRRGSLFEGCRAIECMKHVALSIQTAVDEADSRKRPPPPSPPVWDVEPSEARARPREPWRAGWRAAHCPGRSGLFALVQAVDEVRHLSGREPVVEVCERQSGDLRHSGDEGGHHRLPYHGRCQGVRDRQVSLHILSRQHVRETTVVGSSAPPRDRPNSIPGCLLRQHPPCRGHSERGVIFAAERWRAAEHPPLGRTRAPGARHDGHQTHSSPRPLAGSGTTVSSRARVQETALGSEPGRQQLARIKTAPPIRGEGSSAPPTPQQGAGRRGSHQAHPQPARNPVYLRPEVRSARLNSLVCPTASGLRRALLESVGRNRSCRLRLGAIKSFSQYGGRRPHEGGARGTSASSGRPRAAVDAE